MARRGAHEREIETAYVRVRDRQRVEYAIPGLRFDVAVDGDDLGLVTERVELFGQDVRRLVAIPRGGVARGSFGAEFRTDIGQHRLHGADPAMRVEMLNHAARDQRIVAREQLAA